jgi:Tfp pilus assembly protein PilV
LLEAMMASLVLSILVLGICTTFTSAYQQAQSARTAGTAAMLADEITSKPMADPGNGSVALGPGSGMTSRSQFTHVTNYNGYTDSSTAMPLLGGGSLDVTSALTYSRQVAVVVGAKASVDTSSPATDFAIVTVTVTAPDGQVVNISKFVANDPVTR